MTTTPADDPPRLFDRSTALRRLATEQFDVVVVGGGITGAGVALDAASRGLRTALVEKDDLASGTSSKSSKMVHGGLRYLQQKEFRLVYENLAERQRLLDNAPHLVSPLPFLIPLFGRGGVVSKTVTRSYSTALWLYDLTGGFRIGSRHRRVTKAEAVAHLPSLKTDHLVAGFLYFDARADDARLTLSIARTAVMDYGAVVANYAPVVGFLTDAQGAVEGVRIMPRARPGEADDGTFAPEVQVRAGAVVNASGVWADDVGGLAEGAHPQSLRPAKGVHVTVPADRLPCDVAAVIPVRSDHRSIFVVPWSEGGMTYIGTTDTDFDGELDSPSCTPQDVDYLLEAVNAVTSARLTRADITGVWAGLRPLLAPQGNRHQSERTADLSRRHTVTASPNGVITVTGGKLTTYRKMAEDTVDQVSAKLGGAKRRCVTSSLRLRGSRRSEPVDPGRSSDLDAGVEEHLRARFGDELGAVLDTADGRPELLSPLIAGLPYLGVEVVYAARHEMAVSVDDVLSRRTRALLLDARIAAAAAGPVARLLALELGWSAEDASDRAERFARSALDELVGAGLPSNDAPPLRATDAP
ncbi:MAG: glycerol-3-phosphate dehydrogenase/oxidase [Acidimicrobiales bacterium]